MRIDVIGCALRDRKINSPSAVKMTLPLLSEPERIERRNEVVFHLESIAELKAGLDRIPLFQKLGTTLIISLGPLLRRLTASDRKKANEAHDGEQKHFRKAIHSHFSLLASASN